MSGQMHRDPLVLTPNLNPAQHTMQNCKRCTARFPPVPPWNHTASHRRW
jgi:hypothetical protein